MRSGSVSRTRAPVRSVTWSLRLSRCWTLTVEKTSMPASRMSSTSAKRLVFSTPGAFVCASSSTRQSSGARARMPGRLISSSVVPRYSTRRRGTTSRPAAWATVATRPCGSRYPITTSLPASASARPSWSMRNVLPTPATIPRKILWRPRGTSGIVRASSALSLQGLDRRGNVLNDRMPGLRLVERARTVAQQHARHGDAPHVAVSSTEQLRQAVKRRLGVADVGAAQVRGRAEGGGRLLRRVEDVVDDARQHSAGLRRRELVRPQAELRRGRRSARGELPVERELPDEHLQPQAEARRAARLDAAAHRARQTGHQATSLSRSRAYRRSCSSRSA